MAALSEADRRSAWRGERPSIGGKHKLAPFGVSPFRLPNIWTCLDYRSCTEENDQSRRAVEVVDAMCGLQSSCLTRGY